MPNKESQLIEFKSNWRDEYLKAIASFANDKGGELIIGMDDRGNPVGLKNAERLLEDLPNRIRNKLGIIPSLEVQKIEKTDVVKVIVKPSSVPISYDGKFYIRSGSTVQELAGTALSDFLLKRSGKSWDELFEDRGALDNLDHEAIEQFKRNAAERIPSIIKETDTKVLLQKLKLLEGTQLRRAAVLLFGKQPQNVYLQAIVKIGRFLTNTDIQFTDIVDGNLFQQVENTLEILRSKYLVSNIHFEGIHRRDILEYPYEALREALINALIHRDYSATSHVQVRVYKDRLIVMNVGRLPPEIPVEKLKTEHPSLPRNPLLAQVFYYAGLIEAWGRGTIKIVENCVKQGLPEPDFEEDNGIMQVTFYKDKWNEENLKKLGLNDRQMKAVAHVKANKKITLSSYKALITDVSEKTLYRDLQDLVIKKILKESGEKKGRSYELL
ncbi:MAG TPA: transcriptional regulator [bacterium]|nr:transcriptional regulator [bacterium]